MLIDLYGVLSHEGEVKRLAAPIEAESFVSKLGDFAFVKKQDIELAFTNVGGKKIEVTSHLDVTLDIPCDRCLTDVPWQISVDSTRTLNFGEESPDADETLKDMPFIDGTEFDVEKYAYSEILENFPMKVLCKTDCKGICNVCGMNLNHGSCECDRQVLEHFRPTSPRKTWSRSCSHYRDNGPEIRCTKSTTEVPHQESIF